MNWEAPLTPPDTQSPDFDISESKKFEKNGKWFEDVARHIVREFYNPPVPGFNADILDAPFFGMENVVDDVIDNYAHYYGHQNNPTFFDQTKTSVSKSPISKYIPSHKIYQLINHVEGNCTRIIKPIKDSISSRSISRETLDRKKKRADRIYAAVRLKNELKSAKIFGLEFEPSSKKYATEAEAENGIKNYKDQYEIMAADIARSHFHQQYMGQQFLEDGRHIALGGAVGCYIYEDGGKIRYKVLSVPNSIWDYRATDDYMTDAMHAGFIDHMTSDEIIAKYGDEIRSQENGKEKLEWIKSGCKGNGEGDKNFRTYYNNNPRGLTHWNLNSGTGSVCTIFFLARRDMRVREKTTQYGVLYPTTIDDKKEYDVDGMKVKGSDIPGDFKVWMVHKVTLIGNAIAVDYGYYPYQVQLSSIKQMPQLPIKFFAHRFMMGYFRSVTSRLKAYNQLRELFKIKIQQKVARDKGVNHVFDETQFGEDESVLQMLEDFEKQGLSGINRVKNGGQGGGGQDFMTKVDMSMQSEDVKALVELYQLEGREMEEIINIPPAALGQQHNLMGKSVQENTVAYSSLGQASMYEGLQEFWRRKLDYTVNLYKLYILKNKVTEDIMPIGEDDVRLMKFTEGFTSEDLLIFIALNDNVEGDNRKMLMSALQAYNQNPEVGYEALMNTIALLKHNTFEDSVQYMERYVEKKQRENEANRRRTYQESQAQAKMQQAMAQQSMKIKEVLDMIKKLSQENLKGAWANVNQSGVVAGNPQKVIEDASTAGAAFLQEAPLGK